MDEKQMLLMAAKAAKAAGLNVFEIGGTFLYKPYANHSIVHRWNPLEDDGDALRLAVKLRLVLDIERDRSCTSVGDHSGRFGVQPWGAKGPEAATRLAIVRAAAQVGRRRDASILDRRGDSARLGRRGGRGRGEQSNG